MTELNNTFATVAEVIDASHYGVVTNWGHRVEATYYRSSVLAEFEPGDRVFLERVGGSQLWMIISHASGNPYA